MQNKSIAYAGNDNVLAPRLRAPTTFSMASCMCSAYILYTHLYTMVLCLAIKAPDSI